MWARRSGVDHSLGMGEAPGSNPGESIQNRPPQQGIKSTDGVDNDISPPLLRALKGITHLFHLTVVMRLCSMYGFAGNKAVLIPANSCRLFALENLSFPMAILQAITSQAIIIYTLILSMIITFLLH
jgi:hypothetical protein